MNAPGASRRGRSSRAATTSIRAHNGPVIDEDARELADLRRRAYGPDADIHADPVALARLSELERMREAERGRRDAPAGASAAPAAAPSESAVTVPAASVSADVAAAPRGEPAVVEPAPIVSASRLPRVFRSPRRLWIPWAASLVVVAVVTAWTAAAIVGASSAPDATLRAVPTPTDAAAEYQADGLQDIAVFESFHGLRVMAGQLNAQHCLFILVEPTFGNGSFGGNCSAGAFPVIADIVLEPGGAEVPQQAIDELGQGTALRFTLEGDVVRVYVGRSPEPSGGPGSGV